ncbi:MAG: MlaD family protein [Candidatus Erginobacter occultus]|nr:MlaD family protein [Candidatus Erginobacter occultus]
MATRAQTIKVGIFVLAGLALTVLVFVVIALEGRKPRDTYYISFSESVSGLQRDAAVLYRGVPVGKVENIRVQQDNDIVVQVGIETDTVTLREGVVAKLELGNLMGGMVVELSGGKSEAAHLPPGSTIPSQPSILENLVKDIPTILEDIKDILANINQAVGGDTPERIGSLVENADSSVVALRRTLDELEELVKLVKRDLHDSGYELKKSMQSFQRGMLESAATMQYFRDNPSSLMWGKSKPKDTYAR